MALRYQVGFANEFAVEALPGALPVGQTSPQTPAYGLVHEVVSGTTFTAPRNLNRRSHLYRIRPSTAQPAMEPARLPLFLSGPFPQQPTPNQLRWDPFEFQPGSQDFLTSLVTLCGNGSAPGQQGMAIHVYLATASMRDTAFSNADGEMLILPESGGLRIVTEYGILEVVPNELALISRGCKFRVELLDERARGFVCENYGAPFRLPDLGLIGSTGQANAWDFQVPVAAYEDRDVPTRLVHKFVGNLWQTTLDHSPFDVVAWRGNLAPCKYDMNRFVILGTLAYDHAEPSIFCALTSPSDSVVGPNAELMILPPRWLVAEHTFRPPGFHRNCVSEFLALISGRHEGKSAQFRPGGASLHNSWAPHGPDTTSYEGGRTGEQSPQWLGGSLAFMIESRFPFSVTEAAMSSEARQRGYIDCWSGFKKRFDPNQTPPKAS
jgi:homogentisate 1,2-dioxygenase